MTITELVLGRTGSNSVAGDGKTGSILKFRNTYLAAVSALLYVVAVGMVSAYSAPATVDMHQPGSRLKHITPDEVTWIASLPLISAILGNFFSGYVTQKLGRKAVLMYVTSFFVLGWLLIAYAPSVTIVYIGRVLCGFCSGIVIVTVPVYIVEIAPKEIRGLLTTWFQVALSFGMLLIMSLGAFLRWSWLAISGAALATSAAYLMLIMPESPPWLVRQARTIEAWNGLKFLRGKKYDPSKELQQMKDSNTEEQNARLTLKDLLDPAVYRPVGIGVALMFFQKFSGFNSVMAYTVEIFQSTGSSIDSHVAASIVAAVQLVATFTSSILMDRTGRRKLYITSGIFMTVSLFILGLYNFLSNKYGIDLQLYGWIPLATLMMYIFTYSLGVGPIPFVVTPELVSLRTRSLVIAIATFSGSLFAFIVTKTFEDMENFLGMYGVYWLYSLCGLMSVFFGVFCLPETKGLTLDEVQKKFSVNAGH